MNINRNLWTPEALEYCAMLHNSGVRFIELGNVANIQVVERKRLEKESLDSKSLYVSMTMPDLGSVYTLAGFLGKATGKKYAKVDFTETQTRETFLVYSCSKLYRMCIDAMSRRCSGTGALSTKDIASIHVPDFDIDKIAVIDKYSKIIAEIQSEREVILQESLDTIIQESLGLDYAQKPLNRMTKWCFECHAHHVTGIPWDHAEDMEPLTGLTKTWFKTTRWPMFAVSDLISYKNASSNDHILYVSRKHPLPDGIFAICLPAGVSHRNYAAFNMRNGVNLEYLIAFLKASYIQDYFKAICWYGDSQISRFLSLPVVLPTMDIQSNIVALLENAKNQWLKSSRSRQEILVEIKNNVDRWLL